MAANNAEKPKLTEEEQQLVDAMMLGLRLTIKALVARRTLPLKTIISRISDQAKDLVGVEFWKKHGAWLRDEIFKKAKEVVGIEDGNEETPRA